MARIPHALALEMKSCARLANRRGKRHPKQIRDWSTEDVIERQAKVHAHPNSIERTRDLESRAWYQRVLADPEGNRRHKRTDPGIRLSELIH